MPELPEVQTVVTSLRPRVLGQTIVQVFLRQPKIIRPLGTDITQRLAGQTIRSIERRAKRIVFHLDDGNCFFIHLGMTGRLTADPPGTPLLKHTHLALDLGRWLVRFTDPRRFGRIWWIGPPVEDPAIGPEPLTLRPRQLAQRLCRTRRAIKTALLDQKLIAGLGNIYADEALHAAGIHPATLACELSAEQCRRLNRAIKTVLRRAIRHRGSTLRDYRDADGNAGAFQKLHRVYARAGAPCLTCRAAIRRIVLGGRSTHFCPTCQPKVR